MTEPGYPQLKENFIPRHFSALMLIRSSLFVSAHIWDLGRLLQIGLSALWSKRLDSGLPVRANTLLILPSSGIWYEPDFRSPLVRLRRGVPLSAEVASFCPGLTVPSLHFLRHRFVLKLLNIIFSLISIDSVSGDMVLIYSTRWYKHLLFFLLLKACDSQRRYICQQLAVRLPSSQLLDVLFSASLRLFAPEGRYLSPVCCCFPVCSLVTIIDHRSSIQGRVQRYAALVDQWR